MTIITECPSCDTPAMFVEDLSRLGGWTPMPCETCGQCMWVHNVLTDSITYDHAGFLQNVCAHDRRDEVNAEARKACRGMPEWIDNP